jgi:ribosomal protein S26
MNLKIFKKFFNNSKFFHCKRCGYDLPKNEAVISGWNCQQSLRHIHCPSCGKIIGYVK